MSWSTNFRFEHKEWASPIDTTPRRAFRAHLAKVAKAIEAIDQQDEYDNAESEVAENAAIFECLSPAVMLEQAIEDANDTAAFLVQALAAANER